MYLKNEDLLYKLGNCIMCNDRFRLYIVGKY